MTAALLIALATSLLCVAFRCQHTRRTLSLAALGAALVLFALAGLWLSQGGAA